MLNPVLLAEEAATIDHLTGGNFILGVGLGYRDAEFQAFGVERRSRVPRFREYIEVMRRLWTEERVTFHGKYLHFDDIGLSLRPKNPAGIPIWVGSAVDDGVKRAAEIGDAWISAGAMSRDELTPLVGHVPRNPARLSASRWTTRVRSRGNASADPI